MDLAIKLIIKDDRSTTNRKALQALHDIRSPLGALKILLGRMETHGEHRDLLEGVVDRIESIAAELLGCETTERVIRPLAWSLERVIREKRMLLKGDCEMNLEVDPEVEGDLVDGSPFARALSNLINNAFEAGASQIRVGVGRKEGQIVMTVGDNGKGIPSDTLRRLTVNERCSIKKSGHGLGLEQVRDFARQYNGFLKISSESGRGTEVTVVWSPIA